MDPKFTTVHKAVLQAARSPVCGLYYVLGSLLCLQFKNKPGPSNFSRVTAL